MSNGEMHESSPLADDAGLDKDVISVKLALDVVAVILERGMMEMLIAAALWRNRHQPAHSFDIAEG